MNELNLVPVIKLVIIPADLQKQLLKNTSLYYQNVMIWIDDWEDVEEPDDYTNCIKSFCEWMLFYYGDIVKQYKGFYVVL